MGRIPLICIKVKSLKDSVSVKNLLDTFSCQKPSVICITGQMAAGKNFVCSILERLDDNLVSIDMDKVVHTAIESCTKEILKAFEKDAFEAGVKLSDGEGKLNRRVLGSLIFPNPSLLRKQELIVYPKTIEITNKHIEENLSKGKSVIINATVLFKTPELMEKCSSILFVKASFLKRLFRAKKRDKMPLGQILHRFYAQRTLLKDYEKTGKKIIIVKN